MANFAQDMRKDVELDGIPLKWNTNLSDQDIRVLYFILTRDAAFTEPGDGCHPEPGVLLSLRIFHKLVEFRDGACLCIGVGGTMNAMYRTTAEWETWEAQRRKAEELRAQREASEAEEREFFWQQELRLIEACTACLDAGEFDRAYRILRARTNLLLETSPYRYATFVNDEVFMRLSGFPCSTYGLDFLAEHGTTATSYVRFASAYSFWRRDARDDDLGQIWEAAANRFPTDGMLIKEACLFWERRGNLHLALRYCRNGMERGLTDDTKTGFAGREARLLRKAAQTGAE